MEKLTSAYNFIFKSYKHTALFLLVFGLLLTLPIVTTFFPIKSTQKILGASTNNNRLLAQAQPNNNAPIGYLDGVDNATCSINGWTADPDDYQANLAVHVYKDGSGGNQPGTFIGAYVANVPRPDVNKNAVAGNHGYNITFDASSGLMDGQPHTIYVYGIDAQDSNAHTLLGNSGTKTLTCPAPAPKNLIPNCDSFGDVDGDGKISMADAQAVSDFILKKRDLTLIQKVNGNVDLNGGLTESDALAIAQYVNGTISTFPACKQPTRPLVCGSLGDVNNDGKLSGTDLGLMEEYIGTRAPFTAEQQRADVDGDGVISVLDLANFTGGGTFPACSTITTTPAPTSCTQDSDCQSGFTCQAVAQGGAIGSSPAKQCVPSNNRCPLKPQGDANCDGKINTDDFNVWRDDFLWNSVSSHADEPHLSSDFNSDNKVNTDDFNIWRDGFLNSSH